MSKEERKIDASFYEGLARYVEERFEKEETLWDRLRSIGAGHCKSKRSNRADACEGTRPMVTSYVSMEDECATGGETGMGAMGSAAQGMSLGGMKFEVEESFSHYLIQLIKRKEMEETEVYKNALIDRRLFSKIRSSDDYTPKKSTVIALAIGMQLSLRETNELLGKAGYTLTRSKRADVIVEYFIDNGVYDFFEINKALESYREQPIGDGC